MNEALIEKLTPEQLALTLSSPAGFATLCDPNFRIPPHIALLNKYITDLAAGRIKRLIVQMPPRHGKSELCSRYTPPWYLGLYPHNRIILASYEHNFAQEWGKQGRELYKEYAPTFFGQQLSKDSRSASSWGIDGTRGRMYTAGAGGSITGKGAQLFIIDDPVKGAEQANSALERQKMKDWYWSVVRTRLEPGGSMMLIMTRWHYDDLAGYLIREGEEDWTVLDIPALCINQDTDPLNRIPGTALWPERYSTKELKTIQRGNPRWFSALYQQRPTEDSGDLFKKEWFKYFTYVTDPDDFLENGTRTGQNRKKRRQADPTIPKRKPTSHDYLLTRTKYHAILKVLDPRTQKHKFIPVENLYRYAVCDLALTTKTRSDYTVIGIFGHDHATGMTFLLDMYRKKIEGPDILPVIKKYHKDWRLDAIFIERVAFQAMIVQMAQRAGLPVRELRPDRDKETRALSATPAFEQGNIFFNEHAPYLVDLENELLKFPALNEDDQVDVIAYGIGYCRPQLTQHNWLPNLAPAPVQHWNPGKNNVNSVPGEFIKRRSPPLRPGRNTNVQRRFRF